MGRKLQKKFKVWGEKKMNCEAERRIKRSECTQVGLELRLYWFCWLCLSPPQRTQLAYDVWLFHLLPLQRGTWVRKSGTTGTLCFAAGRPGAGQPSEACSSLLHRELMWARESRTLTCTLTSWNTSSCLTWFICSSFCRKKTYHQQIKPIPF